MPDNTSESWHSTWVRCLASSRADERPISFFVDDVEIEVRELLKSWREPGFLYFQVETEDRKVYDLRHDEYEDRWQVRLGKVKRIEE